MYNDILSSHTTRSFLIFGMLNFEYLLLYLHLIISFNVMLFDLSCTYIELNFNKRNIHENNRK